ncbi:MAG: methyltransferase domain-containing protein, partial [Deltaproteobacteria bacterium]|nr:methyltransferase domain-containing protein [Deltaproteobacteria bacterium]
MDGPRGSEALRCTVRGCGRGLLREGARLACAEGHSFDRARGGWYHLAQPQDRRSREPGDGAPAVAGRELLRTLGLGGGVLEAAARLAGDFQGVGVDVGCGGGALLERLHRPVARELFGVDLSAAAARVAARRGVATILVANADRGLPFRDGVVAAAFSLDARRPAAELARVLAPQG